VGARKGAATDRKGNTCDDTAARTTAALAALRADGAGLGLTLWLPNLRELRSSSDGRQRAPVAGERKPGGDWPWRGAYLSYAGEAMPCWMESTPDRIRLGNVVRDGVAGIWNNSAYDTFRAQLQSDTPPEDLSHLRPLSRAF
jgi:hypothetical protein